MTPRDKHTYIYKVVHEAPFTYAQIIKPSEQELLSYNICVLHTIYNLSKIITKWQFYKIKKIYICLKHTLNIYDCSKIS